MINAARSVAPIVAVVSEDEPRDGVTTVSCRLASELVAMRRSVAVVDCDFADPQLHERIDQPLGAGLAAVLAGDAPVEQVFGYYSTSGGRFLAITAGEHHVRRAPLLSTSMAAQAVQRLSELADIVILNSAPLTTQVGQNLIVLANSVVLVGSPWSPVGPEKRPSLLPGSRPYVAARIADPGDVVRRRSVAPRRSAAAPQAPQQSDRRSPRFDVPARPPVVRRPVDASAGLAVASAGRAALSSPQVDRKPPKVGPRQWPVARLLPASAVDWDEANSPRKRRFYHSQERRYLD